MPNLLLKILSLFDGSIKPFLPDLEIKKEMDISPAHHRFPVVWYKLNRVAWSQLRYGNKLHIQWQKELK